MAYLFSRCHFDAAYGGRTLFSARWREGRKPYLLPVGVLNINQ